MKKTVTKMTLVTNILGYGPVPPPDKEFMQRLTINNKGQVWFASYLYGEYYDKHVRNRPVRFFVNPTQAQDVLNSIAFLCDCDSDYMMVVDAGMWELIVTFEDGSKAKASGSWYPLRETDGLSEALRSLTCRSDLFAFSAESYEEAQEKYLGKD